MLGELRYYSLEEMAFLQIFYKPDINGYFKAQLEVRT